MKLLSRSASLLARLIACLVATGLSAPALAVDGVIEINQSGVESSGGFPFVISEPGSYRLTGNLTLPVGALVSAIQVNASDVTIDLNGFGIIGPGGCTDTGTSISCSPSGAVSGVSAASQQRLRVQNGVISKIRGHAIDLGAASVVEDVVVEMSSDSGVNCREDCRISRVTSRFNQTHGVRALNRSLVNDSVVSKNGAAGIEFNTSNAAYQGNSIHGNYGATVTNGRNAGGNVCDGVTTCP